MDPATPPPWRVFDAPGPTPSGPDAEAAGTPATPMARKPSPAPEPLGPLLARLQANPLAVVVGLLLAIGGFALAALLAVGGLGGDVVVDGGTSLGSPAGSLTAGRGDLIVDVGGAVLRPGVYHLPAGARVSDAIAAAGGYSPRVAAEQASAQLNLAAPVHDGDQIVVPSRDDPGAGGRSPGSGGGSGGGGGGGGHLIDLNHASADELDTLPGIGPVTAAKIIAARNESPFTSVDQLLERKLVGQKVFDGLKPLVTV